MRLIFGLLVLLMGSTLSSPGENPNQQQMTQQAEDNFEKADAELNALYDQVSKALPDEAARKKLIHAQKAWGIYRDAQAELDADMARGGSTQPLIYAMSEEAVTRARIAQLKEALKELQAQ